jgi:hypothetical protein
MRVKFIFNHWLPKKLGVGGITLYPYVFFDNTYDIEMNAHIVNHECIHIKQVRSIGWIPFYASYLWQYFKALIKLRDRNLAYHAISFEVEAYGGMYQYQIPQDLLEDLEKSRV